MRQTSLLVVATALVAVGAGEFSVCSAQSCEAHPTWAP